MTAKSPCLDILPFIFREEQISNRIQTFPTETMKKAYLELKGYFEQYKIYAEKLINFSGSMNDENQRKEKLIIKLRCEYYAVIFSQASKLLHEYINFRNRLILELAINVNGLINSIHPNIIQRLNEDEQKELQKYCENIRSERTRSKLQNKFTVCFLNDLIIEDLNYEGVQKDMKGRNVFYSAGLKVSVFEDKALDLQKCEWAKILRD
ncbi:hypothetical protein PFAG_01101 [Plasmodium falciparum Santa Lucia]|uniref:GINS subunit domain-containing protein n=12 Tax=Plasmodium falciparum TaxID=5833 RepID=A0A5K1K8Q3_PLAF7|nr:conserved protein, unknown function [Plasmodium falciparum 3D7]ETW19929.1 hypothetical protein PFFVO_01139 [Plasmodium falciparum Vietnam Oak-Knoll (FVO)]ETW38110.1 hypothetical protein PFTANZ_01210 [Plasmodium falciparum Tanzania (2000708)]ETW39353.1 hypothetical protein PFNF135_06264 [Plasmodium falciparum NF135/5.C10]ETW50756.1 hypothetical protein PFMALIP_01204 [Plasmodium falciparum MaliPS096_E11]ETW53405.1 hypothetical protein PFUGPA_04420 [Plasmodium falciparum Palo Alto/Uganda]ETW6|eukprot:XP_001351792.1 conserved Plasmodium protein, unknown function [Plasmodium falciparum 3D7]